MGSLPERDNLPLARGMIKSDDPALQMEQVSVHVEGSKHEAADEGTLLRVAKFWNVFEGPPEVEGAGTTRYICGCVLTTAYLVGMFMIIAIYVKLDYERPSRIRTKYVSPGAVIDDSMKDFICKCDLPAEIQSSVKNDKRNKKLKNRCYNPDEVRSELDVLQYSSDIADHVWSLIKDINKKERSSRNFTDGYRLSWESYELISAQANTYLFDTSDGAPLAALTKRVDDKGYVVGEGVLSLYDLATSPFLSLPQGLISATVSYNCTSCPSCKELWQKYGFQQATNSSRKEDMNDEGWKFCAEDANSTLGSGVECAGFCRFFRTKNRPWGIAMFEFGEELLSTLNRTVEEAKNLDIEFLFHSRLLYANISRVTSNVDYTLTSLEIDRAGTVWAKIRDSNGPIPNCGRDDLTSICNGTSICQFAPVYSSDNLNSEDLSVECINYATQVDYQNNPYRPECENIVNKLALEFRVPDKKLNVSELCGELKCSQVSSKQITWDNFKPTGENALNGLVYVPAILTSYVPGMCTNNYSQVFLEYDHEDNTEVKLLSIYEMGCASNNSAGCWLTGRYKNITSSSEEDWNQYKFSEDEIDVNETMFACYQFGQKSYHSWFLDFWGKVSGTIGLWLLMLSCVFWALTKLKRRHFRPSHLVSVCGLCSSTMPTPAPDRETLDGPDSQPSGSWQSSFSLEQPIPMAR